MVDINLENALLVEVFSKLQEETGFTFTYGKSVIENTQRYNAKYEKVTLNDLLKDLSVKASFSYWVENNNINIKLQPPKTSSTQKQVNIKGFVYDTQELPQPLMGVNIFVKNQAKGTVSNFDGDFELNAQIGDTIVFSMMGFKTFEYLAKESKSKLTISLQEETSALEEVVVMGLTQQQKRHMASAVGALDVEANIDNKPITSLSQSLQGGVTGIQASQGSGMPGGDSATLRIRGVSTLGYSNPLVLVDGVPMDMNHIDPVTVKSVTILKDAAAAAIYGSRAANGVILVETKRGVAGEVLVTYDGYAGFQSPANLPQTVDGATYMRMYNEAQINAGLSPNFAEGDILATASGENPVAYPDTDWVDLMINRASPIHSHSVSISGGNDLARFAVTGNYMNQQGMIPNNEMERFNIRANTSISLNNKFLLNLDLLAIKLDRTQPNRTSGSGGNRILEDIYRVPPIILPRYPEQNGVSHYGHYAGIVNPLAYAERGGIKSFEDGSVSINVHPKWKVADNFNVNSQFSFRLNSDVNKAVRDNTNFFDYYTGQLYMTWDTQRTTSMDRGTYYYLAANADYTLDMDDHYLFAMAGYSQEETNSGEWDVTSLLSAYAKLNYSYRDKYLLEATIRTDGSSRFGPGNKYGVFPSIAAGWNLHNESFLRESNVINNLKLRASYGQLGNDNIGLYRYQTLISSSHGLETANGNPDITWETVNMLNLGLDVGLFANNKLEITFDVYDKLTKDIILTPQLPFVGGFQGDVPVNAGEVRNRGVEFSVNYNDRINEDFRFSIRPGVSYNKNKIEALVGGPYITETTINEVGGSINSIYGYRTDGLLQASDFDSDGNALIPIRENAAPGDIKYLDLDENGIIDANDQERIGNPTPNLNYFANFQMKYKNFDFEFLLQGTGKSDVPLTGMFALPLDLGKDGGVPTTYYANNYWTPERTDAIFPRISTTPTNNRESSDFWFQNGAYLRLKYVQLGYNLKGDVLDFLKLKSFRVYLNAQNPFTFTSTKLVDPETRGNQWTYGVVETYTVGLNVKF
ncbi:TonB-dependent receptor [Mangrovimonas sp. YM274]|uniref:SusC/RagA family TonB-linked outer membrane protein n=1 Tax=Mangrovimonas sp. YM274 TaxID=3070660 RepID=UPI0027DD09F0|nr:TonB-dependent receptor [Mangrovimonas sp. YM274]WMI68155.1 TonB-dependent receptor [Mangrovimonas sp. YM274]